MSKINLKKNINFLNSWLFLKLLSFGVTASAAGGETESGYVLLEPTALTGTQVSSSSPIDLMTYLKGAYQTFFVVVFSAAIIMIVWAGFEYILTDVVTTKGRAKGRIKNAFFGLAIITLSYLVLYIINQDLVSFNLDLNL